MSQNLQNFVKFQKFQLENLVDFEKCCKTHIFLQKSEQIQPKTSNILPKCCQPTVIRRRPARKPRSPACQRRATSTATCGTAACRSARSTAASRSTSAGSGSDRDLSVERRMHFRKMHFSKILKMFGGLVLGCIKTKFCKKMCV